MTTRWAIDANIIIQQGTARLISGCVEATGGQLVVPEEALRLAIRKSHEPTERRARRIIQRVLDPEHYSSAQRREIIIQCGIAIRNAFADWATNETKRNDGLWTLAPDSLTAQTITQSLFTAGIARPSTHIGIEEDAQCVGQALAAGCRWIASHNLGVLTADLDPWLAHEQAQGRLEESANPFITTVDKAIETMMGESAERLAALAWELGRPDDRQSAEKLPARLSDAVRFVQALDNGGATRTAERLSPIIHEKADPERLHNRLETHGCLGAVERTRGAFGRFAKAARQAQASAIDAARSDPSYPEQEEWDRS